MKKIYVLLAAILLFASACTSIDSLNSSMTNESVEDSIDIEQSVSKPDQAKIDSQVKTVTTQTNPDDYDYVLIFPSDRYPETALHILGAIEQGHSDVCTIDRDGADANRSESLKGIDTREGYDRDEWPMAMCEEGGKGASVAYISASDNRGAGSWVGNELSQYENGTKVLFIVDKPKKLFPEQTEQAEVYKQTNNVSKDVVYNNCAEVKEAGAAPLHKGEPGYSSKLDRDGDGIACE